MGKIVVKHLFILIDEDTGKEIARTGNVREVAELRKKAFFDQRKAAINDPKSHEGKIELQRLDRIRRIRRR